MVSGKALMAAMHLIRTRPKHKEQGCDFNASQFHLQTKFLGKSLRQSGHTGSAALCLTRYQRLSATSPTCLASIILLEWHWQSGLTSSFGSPVCNMELASIFSLSAPRAPPALPGTSFRTQYIIPPAILAKTNNGMPAAGFQLYLQQFFCSGVNHVGIPEL